MTNRNHFKWNIQLLNSNNRKKSCCLCEFLKCPWPDDHYYSRETKNTTRLITLRVLVWTIFMRICQQCLFTWVSNWVSKTQSRRKSLCILRIYRGRVFLTNTFDADLWEYGLQRHKIVHLYWPVIQNVGRKVICHKRGKTLECTVHVFQNRWSINDI